MTPQIILWGALLVLSCLRLVVMCLRDDDPPPLGWLVPITAMWSMILLIRAICLS